MKTKEKGVKKWERHWEEKRLWQSSLLEINRLKSNKRRKENLQKKQRELLKAMKKWVYLKKTRPTRVELAWIIYSQLGWKGYELDEEELWEDLPETDPLEIMELCEAIDKKREIGIYIEPESVIDDETLLSLRTVLNDLAAQGVDIRKEYFSKNWARKNKKHVGGRIQEIAARDKQPWEMTKENNQYHGLLIKKTKTKSKKMKTKVNKKKSSILSSFFGIF
jgi:hypothetical protein